MKNLQEINIESLYLLFSHDTLRLIGGAVLIFLLFLVLRNIFTRYILKFITKITTRTKSDLDDKLLLAFDKPLKLLFVVLGVYLALMYLPLSAENNLRIISLFRSALVIIIAWGLYELTGSGSLLSEELQEKFKVDHILVPFFSKLLRFVIIAFALVLIANEWHYDVNGFIAGLGLGGLAFALAAKDALANVIGGIIIIMEKPFSIGDWVHTPSVEGIVEDINFRSTKFRTFPNAVVTVPNSTLSNEAVTNWTRMGKRRLTFYLGVTYSTSREKLQRTVERIDTMLREHEEIHNGQIMVYFEKFNDSSLDIFIYCFTNTTVWNEFLSVREDVNYKIMDILEDEGVDIAFPSHSIYFENSAYIQNQSV